MPKSAKLGIEAGCPIPRKLVSSIRAAMSQFRAFVSQVADPRVLQRPEDLRRFLDGLSAAHENDLQAVLAQNSPVRRSETRFNLKHSKPDPFESNKKGRRSFKQWSDEFKSWTEHILEEYLVLLETAADLEEWDDKKFRKAAVEQGLVGANEVECPEKKDAHRLQASHRRGGA